MASKVEQLYAEMKELADRCKWLEEEDRIQKAIESAVQSVYDELNIFDGYDPEGYLECYATKMKLQGVPEDHMVASFQQLVAPNLCEQVQELARHYEDSWDDFEVAIKQEYYDYLDLEMRHILSKVLDDNKEGVREQAQIPSNVIPRNEVRAKLEAIIDECLLQDGSLLQAQDEDIIKAVYEKLNMHEVYAFEADVMELHGPQSEDKEPFMGTIQVKVTMACEPKDEEILSKVICDMDDIPNTCGNANEDACHDVTFIQGNMVLGCPRVCKQYLRGKKDSLQVLKLYPRDKEDENILSKDNSRHMCEHSPTTDWKGAYDGDLNQDNNDMSMQNSGSHDDIDAFVNGAYYWDMIDEGCSKDVDADSEGVQIDMRTCFAKNDWKAYEDDLEREVNAIFMKHTNFYEAKMQSGCYEPDGKVEVNEEGLENGHDLFRDVATNGIIHVPDNTKASTQKEVFDDPCVDCGDENLKPQSQEKSECLESHDNNMICNVDAVMNASPNVCLKCEGVLKGCNGLLVDNEKTDNLDDSTREGSTANGRPTEPYGYVQVVMPLEMDSQELLSKESSEVTNHGPCETTKEVLICVHLDTTDHDYQNVGLQEDNGFDEIDPELDAILDDALGDFMLYNRSPSVLGSSRVTIGQLSIASEDVKMSCEPNGCDNSIDLELEAILDDALMEFACMHNKQLGIPHEDNKDVDMIMHADGSACVELCGHKDEKVQSIEMCLCLGENSKPGPKEEVCESADATKKGGILLPLDVKNEFLSMGDEPCQAKVDFDGMLPSMSSKMLMQLILGVAIQYAFQRQHAWLEENFEVNFFQEQLILNEGDNHVYVEDLSEDWATYEQGIWHICQKQLVFNPDRLGWFLFIFHWGTSLWVFDPGGEVEH